MLIGCVTEASSNYNLYCPPQSTVDIERNDSGLGSETGNKAVVLVKQRARGAALSKVGKSYKIML